jgi:hypothetical protein
MDDDQMTMGSKHFPCLDISNVLITWHFDISEYSSLHAYAYSLNYVYFAVFRCVLAYFLDKTAGKFNENLKNPLNF